MCGWVVRVQQICDHFISLKRVPNRANIDYIYLSFFANKCHFFHEKPVSGHVLYREILR